MGLTVGQKREELKKVYPSQGWADKVNKMSEAQVIAIFMKFQNEKKI